MKVITFKDSYEKWSDAYFSKLSNDSSIRTITSAYEYCRKLDNIHDEKLFEQVLCARMFKKMGLGDERAAYLAEHIDALVTFQQDSDE